MKSYAVLQEGGSSMEVYLHVSDSLAAAEDFKQSCWEDGAYRTSEVIEIDQDEMNYRISLNAAEELLQVLAQKDWQCGNE